MPSKPKINYSGLRPNKPQALIVHHSAGNIHDTVDNIRDFHIHKRNYVDIGYHKVILNPDGIETNFKNETELIKQGRPDQHEGAHCPKQGMNTKSIGICLIGNFEIAKPDFLQLEALKECLRILIKRHNISVEKIYGHKDLDKTNLCPGKHLYSALQKIKKELSDELVD